MKKITLSAAIMALAMMGCSDVGLDNSVASASTSELKSDQVLQNENDQKKIIADLFSTVPTVFRDVSVSDEKIVLRKDDGQIPVDGAAFPNINAGTNYVLLLATRTDAINNGSKYQGVGFLSVNVRRPAGALDANYGPAGSSDFAYYCSDGATWCLYYKSDYIHMYTAFVKGCNAYGFCAEHKVKKTHLNHYKTYLVEQPSNGRYDTYELTGDLPEDIGIVSSAAIVVENGNTIIQGSVRSNLSNDMAARVYQNYILPEAQADAGL